MHRMGWIGVVVAATGMHRCGPDGAPLPTVGTHQQQRHAPGKLGLLHRVCPPARQHGRSARFDARHLDAPVWQADQVGTCTALHLVPGQVTQQGRGLLGTALGLGAYAAGHFALNSQWK